MSHLNPPETPAIPLPEFTPDQVSALIGFMTAHGEARAQSQGRDFSEVDYLCGCMSALFAIGQAGRVPAPWVFGPLSGRKVFQHTYVAPEPEEDEDEEEDR